MFAGCLSRNLLRQPAKGTPPEIKAEWLMLDEPHSDSSRVILYLPGPFFVAKRTRSGLQVQSLRGRVFFSGDPPTWWFPFFLASL